VCLDESRTSERRSSGVRAAPSPDADASGVDYVSLGTGAGESGERMAVVQRRSLRVLGRYLLGEQIAAGGMATVHLGRLLGAAGFSRTVAVKRLHAHLARNPEFVQRFIDEARIASRMRHANIVQTLDIVSDEGELLLVLDYVHGESFAKLRRLSLEKGVPVPPNVASAIVVGVLRGLHAAHEAKTANGTPLGCVHRDVSPQNILVGADGVARVLDFGIAKAAGRLAESLTRNVKGKLAYMSPQQVAGDEIDRRADVFAAGVVLWEALAGERLFRGDDAAQTIDAVYHRAAPTLADRGLGVPAAADAVLAQALSKSLEGRYETADAMARALETAIAPAHEREVAEWVERIGKDAVAARANKVSAFERADMHVEAPAESDVRPVDRLSLPLQTTRPAAPSARAPKVDLDSTFQPPAKRRRDALVPPPMPGSLSVSVEIITAATHANDTDRQATPPVSLEEAMPKSRTVPIPRNPTPLVMTMDDVTRSKPVTQSDAFARMNVRTPISNAPFVSTPARTSSLRLALLVIVPPLVVAAAVLGLVVRDGGSSAGASATGAPPPQSMALVADPFPPPSAAPVVAPPPAVVVPPIPTVIEPSAAPSAKRTQTRAPIKRVSKPPSSKPASGIPRDRN